MKPIRATLAVVLLLPAAATIAQQPTASQAPPTAPTVAPPEPAGAGVGYRIGPGDVLHVAVYGHEDLDQTVVVQTDGTILFPLVGTVPAAGATSGVLEKRIGGRLADGYIRDALVNVTVTDYRSQVVFVVGEVSRPGRYPLAGETRIVELLARAGPLTRDAGGELLVLRPRAPVDGPVLPAPTARGGPAGRAPDAEVLHVDLQAIQSGRLDENVVLQPNDTVFVPVAEQVFVTGEVRSPGAFPYQRGLTARRAVALAGGFTEDASTGSAKVVREVGGSSKERKVELDAPLRPGDIVVIKKAWF